MKNEKSLLITLAAIQFTYVVEFIIMAPLGPQLMRIFQITPQQFGFILSAYAFSAGICGFLSAFVVDKFDRKHVLSVAYIGFLLGTLGCAFAPSYMFLLVSRTITGAFGGLIGSQVFAVIGDTIPFERRGQATGIVTASFSLASVLGVPAGLYLANTFGWHSAFMAIVIVGVVVLCLIFAFIPNLHGHIAKQGEFEQSAVARPSPFAVVTAVTSNPNQLRAILLLSCLIMGQFAVIPFLAPYMVSNVKFDEIKLPFIYLVGGIASSVSAPFVGKMVDKIGGVRVLMVASALSIIPLFIATNLPPVPIAVVLCVSTLMFIFISSRMISAMALINSTVLPQQRGSFLSISNAIQQLSGGAAALLAGIVVVKTPTGELQNYQYLGYFAIALSFAAIVIVRGVKSVSAEFPHENTKKEN